MSPKVKGASLQLPRTQVGNQPQQKTLSMGFRKLALPMSVATQQSFKSSPGEWLLGLRSLVALSRVVFEQFGNIHTDTVSFKD